MEWDGVTEESWPRDYYHLKKLDVQPEELKGTYLHEWGVFEVKGWRDNAGKNFTLK